MPEFTHRKPLKLRGTRLLAEIIKFILAEPKRFDMDIYVRHKATSPNLDAPACGTVACIAGWADVLTTGFADTTHNGLYGKVHERAMEVLGLTEDEANELFFVSYWPHNFRLAYNHAAPGQEKADVAAARVQAFIVQKRRENKRKRDAAYRERKRAARLVTGVKRKGGKVVAFNINRERWRRGPVFRPQFSALINEQGNMCCLGFYAAACGVNMTEVVDVCYPTNLNNLPAQMEWLRTALPGQYRSVDRVIAEDNDSLVLNSEAQREEKVKEHFAAQGITVTFIN